MRGKHRGQLEERGTQYDLELIYHNLVECLRGWGEVDGCEYREVDRVHIANLNVDFVDANFLMPPLVSDGVDLFGAMRRARAYYADNQLPFTIWALPSRNPEALNAAIDEGEVLARAETRVQVLDLRTPRASGVVPDGIEITRVEDESSFRDWWSVLQSGFGFPDAALPPFLRNYKLRAGQDRSDWAFFLARKGRHPIACLSNIYGSETVHVNSGATLELYRHRGVASALIDLAVQDAAARGYASAYAITSPASYKLCLNKGFQERFKIASYSMAGPGKV